MPNNNDMEIAIATDRLEDAIQRLELVTKETGGYMPALATLLRTYADGLASKYPDDTNGGGIHAK